MQLWEKSSSNFRIRLTYGEGFRSFREAGGMPAVYWPSGSVCWQITAYLISLRLSRCKSSTLCTYAAELSPVLRFLYSRNKSLEEIDDDLLIRLANWLLDNGLKGSRVNRIIGLLFQFLIWHQKRCFSGRQLIGFAGTDSQITVTQRRQRRNSRSFNEAGFDHPALAERSIPRLVTPMPIVHIQKLQGAIKETAQRSFIRARNRALLLMIIEGGLRRSEVSSLTKTDFTRALTHSESLRVKNAKRRDGDESARLVPVDIETLKVISDYVNRQRAALMIRNKDKNRNFKDLDFLFCKENGEMISPSTITRLFLRLKAAANISTRAHPHMLRHRWITLQLVALLKELQNLGSPLAPGLILTTLTRLASRSGHASIDSLWNYVDFASDEMLAASFAGDKQTIAKATLHQISSVVEKLSASASADSDELNPLIKELRTALAIALAEGAPPRVGLTGKLR